MRALAMTGIETAAMIPSIMSGSLMRATPPWDRMSAGTRSSAITATAPASSAIFACSGVTTSMITPPLSISAMPRLTRAVPVTGAAAVDAGLPTGSGMPSMVRRAGAPPAGSATGSATGSAVRRGRSGGGEQHPGAARGEREVASPGPVQVARPGGRRRPHPGAAGGPPVGEEQQPPAADGRGVDRRGAENVDVRRVEPGPAEGDQHVGGAQGPAGRVAAGRAVRLQDEIAASARIPSEALRDLADHDGDGGRPPHRRDPRVNPRPAHPDVAGS